MSSIIKSRDSNCRSISVVECTAQTQIFVMLSRFGSGFFFRSSRFVYGCQHIHSMNNSSIKIICETWVMWNGLAIDTIFFFLLLLLLLLVDFYSVPISSSSRIHSCLSFSVDVAIVIIVRRLKIPSVFLLPSLLYPFRDCIVHFRRRCFDIIHRHWSSSLFRLLFRWFCLIPEVSVFTQQ